MILSGRGRFPAIACTTVEPRGSDEVAAAMAGHANLIARGNGRAYGDCAINPAATLLMGRQSRLLSFDPDSGRLCCEAGTLLSDLLAVFVPRGWFPPVTPGTKFVTVGGMIAADVHGKNHHCHGSFGDHVESLDLAVADGRVLHCSKDENAELFAATRGGMGLTGVILRATFRLSRIETAVIRQETRRAANLREVMELFEAGRDWTYSVAWIDCLARGGSLGRSLLYLGEHARTEELDPITRAAPLALPTKAVRRVPMEFPAFALNRLAVAAFNEIYFRSGRPGTALIDYDTFFYPLDAILEWNRIYGRAGFTQYQCVLPKSASQAGMTTLLNKIAASGAGSFLAVLKLFGRQDGLLSFPMEGYTLALDFRASAPVFSLLIELDAIVRDYGGRLYLAKDARCGAGMMSSGYPGLAKFQALRSRLGAEAKFQSLQSQRLAL